MLRRGLSIIFNRIDVLSLIPHHSLSKAGHAASVILGSISSCNHIFPVLVDWRVPPPPFIASYSWYVFFSPPVWRLHQHRNTGSSKDWYVLLQPNAGCILADWEHTFPGVLSLRLTDRHTDRQLDEDFSHLLLLLLLFASSAVVGGLIDWSTSIIFRSVGGKQTDRQTASKAYFPHLLLLLLLLFVSSAVDEGLIDATQLFLLALVDSRHLWRFSPHFCCCSYCLLQVQLSKNWSIDAPRVFW